MRVMVLTRLRLGKVGEESTSQEPDFVQLRSGDALQYGLQHW